MPEVFHHYPLPVPLEHNMKLMLTHDEGMLHQPHVPLRVSAQLIEQQRYLRPRAAAEQVLTEERPN